MSGQAGPNRLKQVPNQNKHQEDAMTMTPCTERSERNFRKTGRRETGTGEGRNTLRTSARGAIQSSGISQVPFLLTREKRSSASLLDTIRRAAPQPGLDIISRTRSGGRGAPDQGSWLAASLIFFTQSFNLKTLETTGWPICFGKRIC